ncbi:MAG TPA: protoporphyrinogen oxidase [Deltaproteobacteria bacterium]|nr:protoporphyrinogen oxidase [Deltaproteobacteria bacterium]
MTHLQPTPDGWEVKAQSASGTEHSLLARHVILACPAPAQARIVAPVDNEASEALHGIPYGPVVVVCTAWSKGSWSIDPEGFGVLLARNEAQRIGGIDGVLGMLFTSSIFPDHTHSDEVLIRTILGGSIAPEIFEASDQELIARARRAAAICLGPERKPPNMIRVYRHPAGIPQYRVGHPARVATVRAAETRHPGLYFIGNHLEGIGVKDCARAGLEVATKITARHPSDPLSPPMPVERSP